MTTLIINGKKHRINADANMPLLWAIRDFAGYTGTKFGCGKGLCGACSIHLDGKLTRSCVTPISAADGKEILTIEGLAHKDKLHPVQQAWIEEDVSQCGYCQSGQIMAAVALLKEIPDPSDADIVNKITNLCRCGTYQQVISAVKRAAQIQKSEAV